VEDEKILADSMALYLERHAYATAVAYTGEESLQLAEENSPDVMVVDIQLPGIDGLEVLRRIREASPSTEVVMITAYASITTAVEAMKRGAFDYLSKPVDLDELCVVVGKALTHARMRRELSYLKARSEAGGHLSTIVGESSCIQALRELITHIATLEAPGGSAAPTVLILGETGVGKELVARAIHYQSPRAAGPFVEINCGAIPAPLLEAEVFGYEKGAYTDAKTAKPGLFEAAEGGTLFLDEIGHMELALQVKLLKVIEEKAVRRLGGLRSKTINARIIAATNRELEVAIAEGAFRADLYYRINVLTVQVPPLRARGADISLLAQHFLELFARQYARSPKTLTPEAEALLHTYPWPGNVRELAHVMERAIFLSGSPCVQAADLGLARAKATSSVAVESGGNVHIDFSSGGINLDDVERQLIVAALQVTAWNRTRAALLLGLSKETLRYRMEKYQLRPPA
jgi:DNA-binding NtrC family response regulator